MAINPTPRLIVEHYCYSFAADEEEVASSSMFGFVAVIPDVLTLQQVRMKIKTEWDWENDTDVDAYLFVLDGKIPVSTKQETQITVQAILAQNISLSFRSKLRCNNEQAISTANNNNNNNMGKKKQKLDSLEEPQSFSSSSTTLPVDQTPPQATVTVTVTTEATASSESDDASMYCATKQGHPLTAAHHKKMLPEQY